MESKRMQTVRRRRKRTIDGARKFKAGGGTDAALKRLDALEDLGAGTSRTPIPTVSRREGFEIQDIWNNTKAKDKKNLPEEELNISQIKTWQRNVQKSGVERIITSGVYSSGSSDLPIVVRHNGNNVLVDGNHRVAAALLTGKKKVKVKVFTG